MAKITGAQKHTSTLRRIRGPAMRREVGKAIHAAAGLVADEAALLITTGSSGGQVKGSKHEHVRSKPGEAPNAEFGTLDRSVHAEKTGDLTAIAVADADHAAPLEFGTSKMEARPFMAPAAKKITPSAVRLVEAATARVIKGGTL